MPFIGGTIHLSDAEVAALAPVSPPPPPPVASSGLWTEYDGAFLGNRTYYAIGCDANGKPTAGAAEAIAYRSQVVSPTLAYAIWGDSIEHHAVVRCSDGRDWSVCLGYGDGSTGRESSGMFWALETIRAEWTDGAGFVADVSRILPPGATGTPDVPNIIPASGHGRMRQWFYIWRDPNQAGGGRDRPAYWQADLEFGGVVDNPCWTGEGSRSRLAIVMREAWWDPVVGWVRGYASTLPWIGDTIVDPGPITYRGWQAYGKSAGIIWRYMYDDFAEAVTRFV